MGVATEVSNHVFIICLVLQLLSVLLLTQMAGL